VPAFSKKGTNVQIKDLRDEVVTILSLLETTESHLRAGDILLGILKIFELVKQLVECFGLMTGETQPTRVLSSQVTPA
jgi:hypothetical protein